MGSLVGFSKVNSQSKYKGKLHFANGRDSFVYFNTQEEMLKFYSDFNKKRDEFISRPKKVYSKNLNMKLVEEEFNKLFLKYQDSVFHVKKEYGAFLDSLNLCQLKYLTNWEYDDISHEQKNIKFKTMVNRFEYYYGVQNQSYGEILVMSNGAENEYEVVKDMFYRWLSSKPHKKIIDDKKLKYYILYENNTFYNRLSSIG